MNFKIFIYVFENTVFEINQLKLLVQSIGDIWVWFAILLQTISKIRNVTLIIRNWKKNQIRKKKIEKIHMDSEK